MPRGSVGVAADFWAAVLGWRVGPSWPGHPELRSFEPSSGDAYVHLQRTGGRGRVHLDVETRDLPATAALVLSAGATSVAQRDRWWTFMSPGGLPFCLLTASAREAPGPTAWPDGHRSRLVQVCIDSPPALHEAEVHFWRSVLGGRWVYSPAREFAGKWHDDAGSPLQLLFQRLDEAAGPVRAHLDHGTDDLAAEVRRIRQLGASDIGPGRGWHALRDPLGLPFCVTENSPELLPHRDLG